MSIGTQATPADQDSDRAIAHHYVFVLVVEVVVVLGLVWLAAHYR